MSAEDGHQFHFSVTSQGSYRVGDGPHEDSEDIGEPFRLTVRAWSLREACEKASAVPLAEWSYPVEDDRLRAENERLRRHLAQHHWNTVGALPEDCTVCAYADRQHAEADL